MAFTITRLFSSSVGFSFCASSGQKENPAGARNAVELPPVTGELHAGSVKHLAGP